ncbi:Tm-1-like ATP-binding domain-containing protein [Rhodocytophaga aerolata]|uniref:Tm-1-like ATP-binding domain-containing protein n=1 Tax=Rhodocytophaga aerolata TaxID=455078 RepID=A0ABT8R0B0_9BACT|nr:Tm-1-like ATP-binding domain-containing protein [Rhodocytophaga aerolata]MDO1445518.1 Tm-1-like ATP-binding domain-containing protein [Rhodocytophaga aerolata]
MAVTDTYILLLGCFDTKGELFSFLRNCILAQGERVISLNTGVMGTTNLFPVDYESDVIALEGGTTIAELRDKKDRGYAVEIMGKGAASIVARLMEAGGMKAAIGMGGGGGTYIALSAMQPIPLGIPKLCLTTIAAKDVSRQMGSKDITLMPSIVDLSGLNSISQLLISQAASAICAMAAITPTPEAINSKRIAISMFGNTTACVEKCSELLRNQGFEVFAFHATGIGGKTMESLISEGYFTAVLDITTTELADELCGGILSAGPDRLNAAARKGIPQVVVPGCLDMVNFAQLDTVPDHYQGRQLYSWAPDVTLMRTNKEENSMLGESLARKVNQSTAPAAILVPLKGISQIGIAGGVFHQPEADKILFEAIKKHIAEHIPVVEVDASINDEVFAEQAVQILLRLIQSQQRNI